MCQSLIKMPEAEKSFLWHLIKQNATKPRSIVEWANGRLKEDFGASNVMVKGHCKVTQHLMFGVIVLFADQLMCLL